MEEKEKAREERLREGWSRQRCEQMGLLPPEEASDDDLQVSFEACFKDLLSTVGYGRSARRNGRVR